ncbi:enoyl-CoA hydratase/isomerase family protein [Variovorax sp. LjRoot84]|uniref:enoyl-CoA hydratase/isomerase family protein n=1 Tax=Variovorax sp. LjRoot84 TaxID=3342340 RepID=UPI003ECF68AC
MSQTLLDITREHGIATLTLQGPSNGNRLTPDALKDLAQLVKDLEQDEATHVLIITGSGSEFFSSGVLSPAIRQELSKEEIVGMIKWGNRLFDDIEALPQIVIAALNGEARAGAAELTMACDIRVTADTGSISLPEAAWGGFPGAGGPVRLPSIVGRARALEIIATGRRVTASELQRIGYVVAVHPAEELMPQVLSLAKQIVANGPLAIRGAKRIINARMNSGFASARLLSDALRASVEYSNDVTEATAAAAEGRPPRFTGR